MMSTLVSAGMGVVTMTSTCAVLGAVPCRVAMRKLLLELEALAGCACGFCAGMGLGGSDFSGKNLRGGGSGSPVRSICAGGASVASHSS